MKIKDTHGKFVKIKNIYTKKVALNELKGLNGQTPIFMVLIAGMMLTGISLEGGFSTLVVLFFTIVLLTLGLLSMMFIILGRADHPRVVGLIPGFFERYFFLSQRSDISDRKFS